MDYFTRQLRARHSFRHDGQEVQPGDLFYATPVDSDYLTRNGKAEEVAETNLSVVVDIEQSRETAEQIAQAIARSVSAAQARQPAVAEATDATEAAADQAPKLTSGEEVAADAGSDAEAAAPVTSGRRRRTAP